MRPTERHRGHDSVPPHRRCRPGAATALTTLALLGACEPAGSRSLAPERPERTRWSLVQAQTQDVDVLLVLDNSGSMAEEAAPYYHAFDPLLRALDERRGGPPDLHLGVTTTDLGTAPHPLAYCEEPGGDGGRLLTGSCWNPRGAPFVVDTAPRGCAVEQTFDEGGRLLACGAHQCGPAHCAHEPSTTLQVDARGCPRCRNYEGQDLADVVQCIAGVGTLGCGFEQPLEAMRLALHPDTEANSGFLRPGSLLTVLLFSDEDDCSTRDPRLFAPVPPDGESPLGPLSSFRCFEYGVTCDVDSREPGPREGCRPREDPEALLHPIWRYVEHLRSLPTSDVLVAVSGGPVPAGPLQVGLDEYDQPELQFSCTTARGGAVPGIRLQALVRAMQGEAALPWAYRSACDVSHHQMLIEVGAEVRRRLEARPCAPMPLRGCAYPGAAAGAPQGGCLGSDACRPDCQVVDVIRPGTTLEVRQAVPPCLTLCPAGPCPTNADPAEAYQGGHPADVDPALPAAACWHVAHDPECDASRGARVAVARREALPLPITTEVACVPEREPGPGCTTE